MFSYAFLPFILALECALDCFRRLQIFILCGRGGLECISDCLRRLQIFILRGRGGLECISDCFRRLQIFILRGRGGLECISDCFRRHQLFILRDRGGLECILDRFRGSAKYSHHTPDTKIDEMMLRSMFSMISFDGFRILGLCGSARASVESTVHSKRYVWPRIDCPF